MEKHQNIKRRAVWNRHLILELLLVIALCTSVTAVLMATLFMLINIAKSLLINIFF